jgi:hypothetical protein
MTPKRGEPRSHVRASYPRLAGENCNATKRYGRGCGIMTLDWTALAIAVIGFAIGFVTGYGVRAFISYRRRKAARLRRSFF